MAKLYTLSTFLLFLGLLSCSDETERYTVVKQDLVESVYSSVTIEPSSMYTVKASNPGYIDHLFIDVGDSVDLDQILLSIRDIQSKSTANNAQLALEIARSNYNGKASYLDDLRMQLKDAQLKRKNDSLNYARYKELYNKKLATKVEYEQSELAFQSSKTQCAVLRNNIGRTDRELKTNLKQAQNTYVSSLSRAEDAVVRNKVKGIVYELFKESGDFTSIQEPIALIGSNDAFKVKMRVDEVDITKVKLGQIILVSLEAYKNQVFKAKVTHISPRLDMQSQTFEIEGEFIEPPEKLYMGLNGEGNIIVAERKNAVVIPLEYLIEGKYVQKEGNKIEVKTGARSLSDIEIVSGLKEGETILKPEK